MDKLRDMASTIGMMDPFTKEILIRDIEMGSASGKMEKRRKNKPIKVTML